MFIERTSVGLDVHARSITAAAIDGVTGELSRARLTPSYEDVTSWLAGLAGPVAVAYEAGPTGFVLYRALTGAGSGVWWWRRRSCSAHREIGSRLMPGMRPIWPVCCAWTRSPRWAVPTLEQEVARDLVRARDDARGDLMRARHRLSKLLLRHGIVYSGGSAWTGAHGVWLRQHARGRLPSATSQVAFDTCYDAVLMVTARRDRLDTQIEALAADCEFTPIVRRLGCLRGIGTLTGFALAVEIGDWHRFTGRSIGSFVGLTPSEHSFRRHPRARRDHQDRQQPRPPPAGRSRLHHRTRYIVSKTLLGRWELASPAARARGDAGNRRLHDRWIRFAARGKWSVIANIAIARELAGWCWSLAVLDDP